MDIPMEIPTAKHFVLNSIINDLKSIDHIAAIALGGSRATAEAVEDSDVDLGIYYYEASPFSIDAIREVVKKYNVGKTPTVTGFYEWGPWVNGGAWIETAAGRVDFIYKNIDQVKSTIAKAINGEWEKHHEQQPPYGFSSIIFLGETQAAVRLYDPSNILSALKEMIAVYPPRLKQSVIQQSLWSAEFTIWQADGFSQKNDLYNFVGCVTRALKNIVDTLFALNGLYPMGDKRAIEILGRSAKVPENFKMRVEEVLSVTKHSLEKNLADLRSIFHEAVRLSGVLYQPIYHLKKN